MFSLRSKIDIGFLNRYLFRKWHSTTFQIYVLFHFCEDSQKRRKKMASFGRPLKRVGSIRSKVDCGFPNPDFVWNVALKTFRLQFFLLEYSQRQTKRWERNGFVQTALSRLASLGNGVWNSNSMFVLESGCCTLDCHSIATFLQLTIIDVQI